ncbi:MAG: hypothetical protein J1E80_04550 [Desulfovibrionaceae bacterium]|nr:hypothetical protein [Desulfovibrionaceae bacterium]
MSSSDGESRFGTIFMGPTEDREITLERLRDVTHRDIVWNGQIEAEYLDRVKARATERVRALLLQARKRGDDILREAETRAEALRAEAEALRAEAEQTRNSLVGEAQGLRDEAAALRDAARSEGYQEGRSKAEEELAETRRGLAETTAVVLLGIHEQCGHIYEAWRDDLAALLREAVEKGTSLVVDRERAALLEELLDRSMRALLDRRRLIVRVNPVDAALVTDMLADARRGGPHVESWELSTDSGLEPGSLVVESESGLVNNSRGVRRSVVDEVLEHLSLPAGQADEEAHEAFTQTLVREMRAHGVDLQEEGPEAGQAEEGEAAPMPGNMAASMPPQAPPQAPPKAAPEASPQASPKAPAGTPVQAPQKTARKAPQKTPAQAPADMSASPGAPSPASAPAAASGKGSGKASAEVSGDASGAVPPAVAVAQNAKSAPAPEAPAAPQPPRAPAPGPDPAPQPAPPSTAADPAQPAPDAHALSEAEARDMVQEFLGADGKAPPPDPSAPGAQPGGEGLPPDVADELLADMGFGPDSHKAGAAPEKA